MDDTVYRQAAIDALNEYFVRIGKLKKRGLSKGEKAISLDTVGAINSLPPAEPERKKGRWYLERYVWLCDQCGKNPTKGMGYVQGPDELFDFCPNCGADMKGEQDGDQ